MSDADQNETNQESAGGQAAGSGEEIPVSRFEIVPLQQTDQSGLYSFRHSIEAPPPDPALQKKESPQVPLATILVVMAFLALIALAFYAVPSMLGPTAPVAYIDLGSQRFDPAGLSGRLIARWQDNASYQLFLDPIDQGQTARFAVTAEDPPRQLSVTLRFRDADGLVACQKSILLPPPLAHEPGAKIGASRGPQQTATGDTVENMTGQGGEISEIDLTGPLPCPAKAYATFKSWDFFTDFPTLDEQDEWLRHEKALGAKTHGGNNELSSQTQRLPVAIEGDDVIVADNPSHGTVETSGGREFYLGVASMHNRSAAWQVFPAAIHFRCDKSGSCLLTRSGSHASLQARLLK